ncbi:MAG: hypothetical protein ACRC6B_06775 [Fusobacteriaceae bacterium]
METMLRERLLKGKAENEGFCYPKRVGINYRKLIYVDPKDMKEAKKFLKKGAGVIIDEKSMIYYCKKSIKIFFLTIEYSYKYVYEYTYGKQKIEPNELMAKEISVAEAEQFLEKSFETKKQDLKRRKEHEEWLSN